MNVEITGRHVEVTPPIRAFVLKRLRKFSRLFGDHLSFHVILEVVKQRQTAEVLLKSKYLDLAGKGQTSDLYASITRAIEKIEKQSLKHKHKIIEGKRHRAQGGAAPAAVAPAENREARLGSRKRRDVLEDEGPLKPMHLDEAILELSQAEYPFVVFRSPDTGRLQVLYRRKDGATGLIQG